MQSKPHQSEKKCCNLCGANNTKVIEVCEDPYKVVQCLKCGLAYVSPLPTADWLESHYDEEIYYKDWIEKQYPQRKKLWEKRFKGVKNLKTSGKLLDVGCGLGTFLDLAKREGFDVQGTEISEYGSQFAVEKYGLKVFNGLLEEARFDDESFDVVTIWHVLEHVFNPKATLQEVYRILKPGGLIVVAVPNLDDHIMKILYFLGRGKKLKLFSVADKELHLHHFTERTLQALLNKNGFKPINIGIDYSQIAFSKRLVDYIACVVRFVTLKNYGHALKIAAIKRGA